MTDTSKGDGENTTAPALAQVSEGYVVLPYTEHDFRDFIEGLLGSPQTITRRSAAPFEITFDDLRDIHQLLMQRIAQNDGKLVNFRARIGFDDDSAVELQSIQELLTYNEVRAIQSNSVQLRWVFLVKFPDKNVPEKQSVSLSLNTEGMEYSDHVFPEILFRRRRYLIHEMELRIEHTARSWGTDIDSLLREKLRGLQRRDLPLRSWVRRNSGKIGLAVAALFFIITTWSVTNATHSYLAQRQAKIEAPLATRGVTTDARLAYVVHLIATNETYTEQALPIYVIVALFVSLGVMIAISELAAADLESFVLLTRESVRARDRSLQKLRARWLSLLLTALASIAIGIASNWFFRAFF